MSELVAVVFSDEEGRTTGDSQYGPEFAVPYHDGMTVDEIAAEYVKRAVYGTGPNLALPENVDQCIEEEYGSVENMMVEEDMNTISGAWIVSKRDYNIVMSGGHDVGNDSALYCMVHTMKCQLESAAHTTLVR